MFKEIQPQARNTPVSYSESFEARTSRFRRQLILLDAVLFVGSLVGSLLYFQLYSLHDIDGSTYSNLSILPLEYFLFFMCSYEFGTYAPPSAASIPRQVYKVTVSIMLSGGVLFALLYVLRIKYISTDVLALQMALCWFMVSSVRIVNRINYLRAFRAGKAHLEVLIVGTGNRAKQMADILIRNTRWGLNIIGYLDVDPSMVGSTLTDGKQVLGVIDDIHQVLKSNVVDEIIVAIPRAMIPNMETIALACEEEGVKLNVMADFFDVNVARIRLVQMGGVPLLALEPVAQDDLLILFKRIIDFTLTALAMPFILPLMLGVGIAIRLDSPGPAFFTQMRVGKNKRLFKMYKFRSMYSDSESRMKEIEHLNEAEGPIFKIKNDPRVTRVGHFIRKFSIDELPQLFNVLLGDMSLVGPRPMSIRDVDLFDKGIQRKRFSMKPGLTCLWQISGRSNLPFEKWLQLDLEYIENWSLATDFKIIFKTIPVVVKGTGAV